MTDVQTAPTPEAPAKPKRRINFGFDKYSGIYVWALLVVVFALWIPDLFLSWDNFRTILSFQAISTIVALGLIIPVAAGAFDLTIAATLTVSAVFTAWALLNHKGVIVACGGALLIGVVIGLANALVVVKFKVDSFIGTLGMSSILAAVAYMISGGGQLVLPEAGYCPFLDFARQQWFGISASVYYAGALATVIWWMLEYTPGGRYLYAVGGNPVAARLAGVKVGRIIMLSFIASAVVAQLRRHRLPLAERQRRPRLGRQLPAAGLLGGVPGRDADPARSRQRPRHPRRHPAAGHRRHRPAAGRRSDLRHAAVQRRRADHRDGAGRPHRAPPRLTPPTSPDRTARCRFVEARRRRPHTWRRAGDDGPARRGWGYGSGIGNGSACAAAWASSLLTQARALPSSSRNIGFSKVLGPSPMSSVAVGD